MDGWTLRAAAPEDAGFLYEVYAGTRREELAPAGWPVAQVEAFLRSQFALQDRHYRSHFPHAQYAVVQVAGQAVGRLYVDRGPTEFRVMDIALQPQHRRRGLGRSLLGSVLAEAAAAGCRVTLHVERNNPALGLYRDLGFAVADDDGGVYLEMRWQGPVPVSAAVRTDAMASGRAGL